MRASGSYTITASFEDDDDYLPSSNSKSFTINKEISTIAYDGQIFVLTDGASSIDYWLKATLTQQADGSLGDLTQAGVTFKLFKSSNLGTTADQTHADVEVTSSYGSSSTGTCEHLVTSLPCDVWTVRVQIDDSNLYWTQDEIVFKVVTISASAAYKTTGGGWILDIISENEKGNFGFAVQYQKGKTGTPKGNFVYIYRFDGYDYIVKSNSWQGGGLSFSAFGGTVINKASFSGKCVIQKIDPATGALVASAGNSKFAVTVIDADQRLPQSTGTDKIAISFSGSSTTLGSVTRSIEETLIGGGNIVVRGN
jgi:hypothetical protein